MPSRAHVRVTKTKTVSKTKTTTTKRTRKKRGNPNKCPVCGKFMGNGKSNG